MIDLRSRESVAILNFFQAVWEVNLSFTLCQLPELSMFSGEIVFHSLFKWYCDFSPLLFLTLNFLCPILSFHFVASHSTYPTSSQPCLSYISVSLHPPHQWSQLNSAGLSGVNRRCVGGAARMTSFGWNPNILPLSRLQRSVRMWIAQ